MKLNFYLQADFDVDAAFGTFVCTDQNHPHIHMMVWSDDPKEGFLTKDGIAAMRSKLTNAIFRDEMQQNHCQPRWR